jgi:protein gp37
MFLSIKALSEFSFQFLDKKARSLFVLSLTNFFLLIMTLRFISAMFKILKTFVTAED